MFSSLGSLLDLLFPPHCLNCGTLGNDLCSLCEVSWIAPSRQISKSPIPIWSSAHYSQMAMRIILLAKENNNRAARKILAMSISQSLSTLTKGSPAGRVVLIPIPSSAKMNRKRGFIHGQVLAGEVAELIKYPCIVLPILFHNRNVKDQSELPYSARQGNLHEAYSVNLTKGNLGPSDLIFLIDDLVTSGSSVREAVRALKSAYIFPEAAISACAVSTSFRLR